MVVNKLRELKDCSERYRDASSFTDDVDLLSDGGGVFCETQTEPGDGGVVASTQSDVVESADAGTQQRCQSTSCDTDDVSVTVSTMTEQQLKDKHTKVVSVSIVFNWCLVCAAVLTTAMS